jgi:hypothetical protein
MNFMLRPSQPRSPTPPSPILISATAAIAAAAVTGDPRGRLYADTKLTEAVLLATHHDEDEDEDKAEQRHSPPTEHGRAHTDEKCRIDALGKQRRTHQRGYYHVNDDEQDSDAGEDDALRSVLRAALITPGKTAGEATRTVATPIERPDPGGGGGGTSIGVKQSKFPMDQERGNDEEEVGSDEKSKLITPRRLPLANYRQAAAVTAAEGEAPLQWRGWGQLEANKNDNSDDDIGCFHSTDEDKGNKNEGNAAPDDGRSEREKHDKNKNEHGDEDEECASLDSDSLATRSSKDESDDDNKNNKDDGDDEDDFNHSSNYTDDFRLDSPSPAVAVKKKQVTKNDEQETEVMQEQETRERGVAVGAAPTLSSTGGLGADTERLGYIAKISPESTGAAAMTTTAAISVAEAAADMATMAAEATKAAARNQQLSTAPGPVWRRKDKRNRSVRSPPVLMRRESRGVLRGIAFEI